MNEEFENDILDFGNLFRNRLDLDILEADLEYIGFGETKLAFETICDHLCDYEIPLDPDEYQKILNLDKKYDLNLPNNVLSFLKKRVVK